MALQIITVVLFTVFFSEALTLVCYDCSTPTCTQNATCSSNLCGSMTTYGGSNIAYDKKCENSASCANSSINLGWAWMSSHCCSSDLCNNATDSDNGWTCYGCSDIQCSNSPSLKCKGDENQCITTTVGSNGTNYTWKGCASPNLCASEPLNSKLNSTLNSMKSILSTTLLSDLKVHSVSCVRSAGSSTFPPSFLLKPDLGGFLLILFQFGCSVLSI